MGDYLDIPVQVVIPVFLDIADIQESLAIVGTLVTAESLDILVIVEYRVTPGHQVILGQADILDIVDFPGTLVFQVIVVSPVTAVIQEYQDIVVIPGCRVTLVTRV